MYEVHEIRERKSPGRTQVFIPLKSGHQFLITYGSDALCPFRDKASAIAWLLNELSKKQGRIVSCFSRTMSDDSEIVCFVVTEFVGEKDS